jgi:quinol monooxygenase YgiN
MAWTHVRHRVEDYPKWKEVFDSTAEYKRSHGWKGYRLHTIEGDNNYLLVMEEFETEDQTREFLASEYLREAMKSAGVSDEPDILVVEVLEEGSDRFGTAQQAAQTAQEGVRATGQTAGGLLGAATGAVSGVMGSTVEATASGAERAAEAVVFPIEGYDEMNVDEISGRLEELSVEELQQVRDYEELHEKRKTLLEQMDRKIRAG